MPGHPVKIVPLLVTFPSLACANNAVCTVSNQLISLKRGRVVFCFFITKSVCIVIEIE